MHGRQRLVLHRLCDRTLRGCSTCPRRIGTSPARRILRQQSAPPRRVGPRATSEYRLPGPVRHIVHSSLHIPCQMVLISWLHPSLPQIGHSHAVRARTSFASAASEASLLETLVRLFPSSTTATGLPVNGKAVNPSP